MAKYALITHYGSYSDAGFSVTVVSEEFMKNFKKEHDYVLKIMGKYGYEIQHEIIDISDELNIEKYYNYDFNFNEIHRILKVDDNEEIDKDTDIHNTNNFFYRICKYYIKSNNLK